MDQESRLIVGYASGVYVVLDEQGRHVQTLGDGERCELWIGSRWQGVTIYSGGYQGMFYQTASCERGRLALCQQVRCGE